MLKGWGIAAHGAALVLVALVLASVGQPLFAEDSWWHLSMGGVYAAEGPWLQADPLLHTAEGPPAPAAWLFDLALHGVERVGGFHALRVLHVGLAVAILALAWSMLRRVSGSSAFASFGLCVFATLAAYRLFQLRPHLATLLGTLLVLRLLVLPSGVPSRRNIVAVVLLFALWANLHGAFLVGLVLLGAAAVGETVAWAAGRSDPEVGHGRAVALGLALGLGLVATLANPSGIGQHLLFFQAGSETPELSWVADEWAPVDLLSWPRLRVPPTPMSWALLWALLPGLAAALVLGWRRDARARAPEQARGTRPTLDPALLATAAVATLAALSAVRLAWLALVPLLLVGVLLRPGWARRPAAAALAAAAWLCVPGFVLAGPWPLVSAGVYPANYVLPYAVTKVDAHPVWLLEDAGIEGNLFNGYQNGNFLGYWLAPDLRVFVNGSLNVPPDVMRSLHRIEQTASADELTPLLDRYGVDVFVGTGAPDLSPAGRPRYATTRLLESVPGWILVFRNARGAVYLRDLPRNRENLERLAAFYASERVPFDPVRGFEVERVVQRAPAWAILHGMLPVDFRALEDAARSLVPSQRLVGLDRLATAWVLLGRYERALAADRRLLRSRPDAIQAHRRQVFCLLHLGRTGEARSAAEALAAAAPEADKLSALLVDAARAIDDLPAPTRIAAVARLPLMPRAASREALAPYLAGEARPRR